MRLTTKTKKEFNNEFKNIVTKKGFFLNKDQHYEYNSSKYGLYICHPDSDDTKILSIFGRFMDNNKAAQILNDWNGNPYSAKMNFHDFDLDILTKFQRFVNWL